MMYRMFLLSSALVLFLSASLAAEVVVQRFDGPLPEQATSSAPLDQAHFPPGLTKVEHPSLALLLHLFKIDTLDPFGETTSLGIRNEHSGVNTVTIRLFPTFSTTASMTITRTLQPKELTTLNLRDQPTGIVPDGDGFIRGYAAIDTNNGPVSAEYFQINPDQDFASGGQLVDFAAGELCENVRVRFLVGGAFTGGTVLQFLLDTPLGGDPMTDPPSVTGTVYRESSTPVGSFQIFTDSFAFEIEASAIIGTMVNFGTMDVRFENVDFGGSGGFVNTELKADNRYSVGLKSTCLDP